MAMMRLHASALPFPFVDVANKPSAVPHLQGSAKALQGSNYVQLGEANLMVGPALNMMMRDFNIDGKRFSNKWCTELNQIDL